MRSQSRSLEKECNVDLFIDGFEFEESPQVKVVTPELHL